MSESAGRTSRAVRIRDLVLGGGQPVRVQTMTKAPAHDFFRTLAQARALVAAGAELVRLAVPDLETVPVIGRVRQAVPVPVVADIHFDYRLALAALEAGADKVRVNPGNLGPPKNFLAVLAAAKASGAAVRVGVNSGSVPPALLKKHGGPTPAALVEEALALVRLAEESGFERLVISLKSSSVADTIAANRLIAAATDWPLHLGLTAAGTELSGAVKSALALAPLLREGIGDTIRVSLAGDPAREVAVAFAILQEAGRRADRPELLVCPNCGRTPPGFAGVVAAVEQRLYAIKRPLKVAVMGCPVNGPGEAREADVGLALGREKAFIFARGELKRSVAPEQAVDALFAAIEEDAGE